MTDPDETPVREFEELRGWDAGAPPLDEDTRHRARLRLFAVMNEPTSSARPLWRRPAVRVAVSGMLAAAVAATVLVAVDGGNPGQPEAPAMRNVSARTVLQGAAAYERRHPKTAAPRDDQFVYTKEIIKETNDRTGATKSYTDEDWRSVDGSHRSWVMEIGHGWWSAPLKKNESVWPPQDWDELRKLPTDPEKLLLDLAGVGPKGERRTSLDEIPDEAWSMIHFDLAGLLKLVPVMPEGLRPAAYEALGMVPGVKAVPGQQDAKGRTGVAITYDPHSAKGQEISYGSWFIFDPETYRFLGFRDSRSSGDGKDKKTYTQLSYLDSWAITDRAKQRP